MWGTQSGSSPDGCKNIDCSVAVNRCIPDLGSYGVGTPWQVIVVSIVGYASRGAFLTHPRHIFPVRSSEVEHHQRVQITTGVHSDEVTGSIPAGPNNREVNMDRIIGVLIVSVAFLIILGSLVISVVDAFRRGLSGLFGRDDTDE